MLVLTRKPGQRIFLNDDIIICCLDIHGYQARIGIQAPREYNILREEVRNAWLRENQSSISL